LSDDAKARHARAEAKFQQTQKRAAQNDAQRAEERARVKAVDEKTSRLKALRLARDAAEAGQRRTQAEPEQGHQAAGMNCRRGRRNRRGHLAKMREVASGVSSSGYARLRRSRVNPVRFHKPWLCELVHQFARGPRAYASAVGHV
jgi:hypothetical protein